MLKGSTGSEPPPGGCGAATHQKLHRAKKASAKRVLVTISDRPQPLYDDGIDPRFPSIPDSLAVRIPDFVDGHVRDAGQQGTQTASSKS